MGHSAKIIRFPIKLTGWLFRLAEKNAFTSRHSDRTSSLATIRRFFPIRSCWIAILTTFVPIPDTIAEDAAKGKFKVQGEIQVKRFSTSGEEDIEAMKQRSFELYLDNRTGKYALNLTQEDGTKEVEIYYDGTDCIMMHHDLGWFGTATSRAGEMGVALIGSENWPVGNPNIGSVWPTVLLTFTAPLMFESSGTNRLDRPHPYLNYPADPSAHGLVWDYTPGTATDSSWGINIKRVSHPSVRSLADQGWIDHPNDEETLRRFKLLHEIMTTVPIDFEHAKLQCSRYLDVRKPLPIQATVEHYFPNYERAVRREELRVTSVSLYSGEIPGAPSPKVNTSVDDARFRQVNKQTSVPIFNYTLKPGEPWPEATRSNLVAKVKFFQAHGERRNISLLGFGNLSMTIVLISILLVGSCVVWKRRRGL